MNKKRLEVSFASRPLAIVVLLVGMASAGPPPDTSADRVLDDFESELNWKVQRQNDVTVELGLPQALGHTGQASLKAVVKAGPVGPKGRNAFRLTKRFAAPQDWSAFDGIQFWLKVAEGAGDMMLCIHKPRGLRYRTRIMVSTADEGQWKFFRVPFDTFRWDFESAKTTAPKLDPSVVTGVSLWRRMPADGKVVFYLDDMALYKPKPPYRGPTISMRTNLKRALVRPGEDVQVLGTVSRLETRRTYRLSVSVSDFFGNALKRQTFDVRPDGKSTFHFNVPIAGAGYLLVHAELRSANTLIYTEDYGVGVIPDLSEEQRQAPSLFGIWVGGVQFAIDHGARWYRTYCEPWRFEPDGRGGYRYIGKGSFPRKNMPFRFATPICYFRGMPKWLTSRPDRSDYKKFPPNDWAAYARFVTWYVNKMKHLIKHWEVWNEPVPYANWMGSFEQMVKLHEVTYKAVKAADPKAVVMGPCPYSFLFGFLEKFFQQGGGKYIDAVVIHAYTRDAPEPGNLDVNFKKVRELAAKYIGPKDLYVTELGWDAGRVGQTAQAQYLVRSYVMALEAGVKALIWHMYWDYKGVGSRGHAILNHNRTPRPALVAYCTAMRMLTGMKSTRRLVEFKDPVRVYEFRGLGRRLLVAWCWDGRKVVRLPVAAPMVSIVDIVGNERKVAVAEGAVTLGLDANPVYLIEPLPSKRRKAV